MNGKKKEFIPELEQVIPEGGLEGSEETEKKSKPRANKQEETIEERQKRNNLLPENSPEQEQVFPGPEKKQ